VKSNHQFQISVRTTSYYFGPRDFFNEADRLSFTPTEPTPPHLFDTNKTWFEKSFLQTKSVKPLQNSWIYVWNRSLNNTIVPWSPSWHQWPICFSFLHFFLWILIALPSRFFAILFFERDFLFQTVYSPEGPFKIHQAFLRALKSPP